MRPILCYSALIFGRVATAAGAPKGAGTCIPGPGTTHAGGHGDRGRQDHVPRVSSGLCDLQRRIRVRRYHRLVGDRPSALTIQEDASVRMGVDREGQPAR